MRITQPTLQLPPVATPHLPQNSVQKQDFAQTLMDAIKEVNASQQDAQQLQDAYMANQNVEVHDVMIAMERATTTMELTMQVRNKLLEAYQEIDRMQV